MFDPENLTHDLTRFLLNIRFKEIVLLGISFTVLSLLRQSITLFSKRMTQRFPQKRMLIFEWVPLVNFLLYFGGGAAAIYFTFNLPREFALGFVAAILVAIGFSLKDVARAIVSGILLLLNRSFQVGDHIQFEEKYCGEVIAIGLTSTTLFTAEEDTITIPNNLLLEKVVVSENHGQLGITTTVILHVSRTTNLVKVKSILEELIRKSPLVNQTKPITLVLEEDISASETPIKLTMKCALKDARTEENFKTQLMLDINAAFLKHKIRLKK